MLCFFNNTFVLSFYKFKKKLIKELKKIYMDYNIKLNL